MLLPDPGYTDYLAGVLLADANPQPLVLKPPYYLPQWHTIDKDVLLNTRLVYLTKIVHDFAYSAFGFDYKNPSILQSKGAKNLAIEVFSLSKGYNMSGFRVGFAVGNKDMIQALKKYQTHTHAGMFGALQDAATFALNHYDDFLLS